MVLSGGFAIRDYSWTNRKMTFYSGCTFSQIITVACKISQLQKFKRSKAERPLRPLYSPPTSTIVWLLEILFMATQKFTFIITKKVLWKLICVPNSCIRYCLCFLMAVKFRLSPYDENIGQLRLGALEPILTALGLDWFSVSNDSQSYQINPAIFIRMASEYRVWFMTETNLAKGKEKMLSICIGPSVAGMG